MKKIIRTKKEVVLNSRTSERGVVSVSFEKLILSEKSLDFTIDVVDYKSIFEPIADIDGNGNVIETEKEFLKLIGKKEVTITNDQAIELEQLAISIGLHEKSGNTTEGAQQRATGVRRGKDRTSNRDVIFCLCDRAAPRWITSRQRLRSRSFHGRDRCGEPDEKAEVETAHLEVLGLPWSITDQQETVA